MPSRRILCVWLPYWATTRLRLSRHAGGLPGDTLVTVQAVRGVRRLVAVCPRAEAAGLLPGQTLTQARALCPALVAAEAAPAEDAAALAALAHWATRYTPLASAAAPDTLWLDIGGCAHLQGSETALAEGFARHLHGWGVAARWAIASTSGAAHALSRYVPGSVQPDGQEAAALGALPIEALRLEPGQLQGLRRLGLKTIGALGKIPRGELKARFGALPGLRLDHAFGAITEPIAWPLPPPDWSEAFAAAEPLLNTEGCSAALALLAGRLCGRLAARQCGGRQFVAGFQRLDGSQHEIAIGTALPVADPAYLLRLLAERLDGLDPGFGIERIWLAVPSLEAMRQQQGEFAAGAAGQKQLLLARMIDALANRLRPEKLWRLAPRDSHIPEQAARPIPPLPPRDTAAWQDDPASPRPIRLLRHPEPIEATALLPDEPPLQFRWRGALHQVQAATGPERIAAEWWTTGAGGTRDYYQVEDSEGGRFWMYRVSQDWFLHGLFG